MGKLIRPKAESISWRTEVIIPGTLSSRSWTSTSLHPITARREAVRSNDDFVIHTPVPSPCCFPSKSSFCLLPYDPRHQFVIKQEQTEQTEENALVIDSSAIFLRYLSNGIVETKMRSRWYKQEHNFPAWWCVVFFSTVFHDDVLITRATVERSNQHSYWSNCATSNLIGWYSRIFGIGPIGAVLYDASSLLRCIAQPPVNCIHRVFI